MILGLGVDLCRIERIRRSIAHFGKDWLDEVFAEVEHERLGAGDQQAVNASIGFAVKEASSKALGTGFAKGVRRQDFIVSILGNHCTVDLTGMAKRRAAKLNSGASCYRVHAQFRLTAQWANALVVLTPNGGDHFDCALYNLLQEGRM